MSEPPLRGVGSIYHATGEDFSTGTLGIFTPAPTEKSIQAISKLTGWDRKTIRKYLLQPNAVPQYRPRRKRDSKLDPFKPYLEERIRAGVWNAQVLLRELRADNYTGGYTILKDWLQPQRISARAVAGATSLASASVPSKTRQKPALGSTPSEAKEAH